MAKKKTRTKSTPPAKAAAKKVARSKQIAGGKKVAGGKQAATNLVAGSKATAKKKISAARGNGKSKDKESPRADSIVLDVPQDLPGLPLESPWNEQTADHHRVVMVNAVVTRDGGCGAVSIAAWDCYGNPTATAYASVQFDGKAGVCLPVNTATLIVPPHGRYTITPQVQAQAVEFRMNQYEVT